MKNMTLKRPKGIGFKIPRKLPGRKHPKGFGKIPPPKKRPGKKWIPKEHPGGCCPTCRCASPRPPGVGPKSGPRFPWRFPTPEPDYNKPGGGKKNPFQMGDKKNPFKMGGSRKDRVEAIKEQARLDKLREEQEQLQPQPYIPRQIDDMGDPDKINYYPDKGPHEVGWSEYESDQKPRPSKPDWWSGMLKPTRKVRKVGGNPFEL